MRKGGREGERETEGDATRSEMHNVGKEKIREVEKGREKERGRWKERRGRGRARRITCSTISLVGFIL